jgi:hypothetical protein
MHHAGNSGAAPRPAHVDDLSERGFAAKKLVSFIDEERWFFQVNDVVDVRAGQLDHRIRPRH